MNICLSLSIMIFLLIAVSISTTTGVPYVDDTSSISIEEYDDTSSVSIEEYHNDTQTTSVKNYIGSEIFLDNFENIDLWKLNELNTSYITYDMMNFKEGKQGLKFVSENGDRVYATLNINKDFSNTKNFIFDAYVYNETTLGYVTFYFTSKVGWSKYFSYTINRPFVNGWNNFVIKKSDINNYGGEDWNNTMIMFRLSVSPITGKNTNVTIDNFKHGDYVDMNINVVPIINKTINMTDNIGGQTPSRIPGFNSVEIIIVLIILVIYMIRDNGEQ